VFDAVGNDNELPGMDHDLAPRAAFAHGHLQRAFNDEEQFVFDLVMVPDELTLQLHHLDVKIVHLADDLGTELIVEQRQLLDGIDFFHAGYRRTDWRARGKEAAEQIEKQIPRPPLGARNDKNKGLSRHG